MALESRGVAIGAVTWILTIAALVFLSLRVYCKCNRVGSLWYDDYVIIFAWVNSPAPCTYISLLSALIEEKYRYAYLLSPVASLWTFLAALAGT